MAGRLRMSGKGIGGIVPKRIVLSLCVALLAALPFGPVLAEDAGIIKSYGISRFGELQYPPDFKHYGYVNPDAPKGGTVHKAMTGAFDSLNPFIIKGQWSSAAYHIYDSLLADSFDEVNTRYGLLAETVEYPRDLSWVIFNMRPEARWHDGTPITSDDVIFTFNTLVKKGKPLYRYYYANVEKVEALGPHRVKFTFNETGNRELPTIIGQMNILPKHYWESRDFEATTLEPPLGSGPYRISRVDPGRSVTLERVPDYWGKDLPVNVGRNNFDKIVLDYYRDDSIAFEAFKAGKVDYRAETVRNWATAYDFPAFKSGKVKKLELPKNDDASLYAFAYNTRREKFSDPRVREALAYAWDFTWVNQNLYHGMYVQSRSYFRDSEMAATGLPSKAELALLEPYRNQVPARVFTEEYNPPSTDGSGNIRSNLRTAFRLLKEAGWEIRNNKLTNVKTGEVFSIQFFYVQSEDEKLYAAFARGLNSLGIQTSLRQVDASEAIRRIDSRDFDIYATTRYFAQSHSPGNEQREYFGSAAATIEGSNNITGIHDPVVDGLIEKIIFAKTKDDMLTATRAMDRVLQWSFYTIPLFHSAVHRIGIWDRFGRPERMAKYALGFNYVYSFDDTWWIDPEKDKAIRAAR